MDAKEQLGVYLKAYKEADDSLAIFPAIPRDALPPGPVEAWRYLRSRFSSDPGIFKGHVMAQPTPFSTKVRAFFSRNPAAVIDRAGTPPVGRTK